MHVTIPYSSGTVETTITPDGELNLPVPVYPSSGEITNPGEMAISTLDGYEAICIKSDQNENVLFSDDAANQAKLGLWHNSANGGLSLAQNNDEGPVLSLSEGGALDKQAIITNARTLCVVNHQQEENGYSLTPLQDSEPCVVYGFSDNLPGNLSEMKDIKINVVIDKINTLELTINSGADIKNAQVAGSHAFFCGAVHGLENVRPIEIHPGGSITGETVPAYQKKYTVSGNITASFAATSGSGCHSVASHAEGSFSTTFAVGSHVEGHNNNYDDGYSTLTAGKFSHCEGTQNQALGPASSVHNTQSSALPSATGSSVYGYQNSVVNVGEFACGDGKEYSDSDGRLFSVGDGICVVKNSAAPALQAQQCSPHSVFKILMDNNGGDPYYYPLIDIGNRAGVYRNLVITATVGGIEQTKTIDGWYYYLTHGYD